MIVYYNGKFIDERKVNFSIKDRGLLLGDGVFETILYNRNKLILFNLHFLRLKNSLKKISIKFNENKKSLENKIIRVIKKNKLIGDRVSIRITITRGNSERGIDISPNTEPAFLITVNKIVSDFKMLPVKLYVSKILRNETSITSQHKTINYLDNILAKNEAKNNGYDDVLFLNSKKKACCASTSNLFYLERGKIYTPPLKDGVLNGTIREILISKKKVAVKSITLNNLKNCNEIFITNSIFGIRPVAKIGKQKFKVGQKINEINDFLTKLGL